MPLPRNLAEAAAAGGAAVDAYRRLAFADLAARGGVAGLDALHGRCAFLATSNALDAAAALIALDGWARRIVLCPPDFDWRHFPALRQAAGIEAIVGDAGATDLPRHQIQWPFAAQARGMRATQQTEWALMTSGTSGPPKLALHNLATLAAAIQNPQPQAWATFYDIRRFGGLQIFLRAILGGGSLEITSPGEALDSFLARLARAGTTHISGTPSHWRKLLMSPAAKMIAPRNVRLSGEIADDGVLGALAALYPKAEIVHAFASTEAGVAFAVDDGHAGFPEALLTRAANGVELGVVDGALRVRSKGTALRYLGDGAPALRDAEGFVDTGDMLERRDGRYVFLGRSGGIINVGGAKVHPEEVEAVLNGLPGVRASQVRQRKSPLTGALVAADVVLHEGVEPSGETRAGILAACRARLAPHKAPASLRFVAALEMTPGGKLVRHG